MEKTVCELFAGVGGFRLGLERASSDWNTVWFSQWEPGKKSQWAHDCYVSHWGDIDSNTGIDISKVDKKKIPNHNLLVGGFPCQDYSVARTLNGANGIEGKKGVLWWQIRNILQEKHPSFALFENVDRLLKSPSFQRGRDFGIILACLAQLNYSCEWRVINAAEYGCAQRRRRVFLFAYKNDTNFASSFQATKPIDIINRCGFFAKSFPVEINSNVVYQTSIDYSDIINVSDNFYFLFQNSGYMTKGNVYTVKINPIVEEPIILRDILEDNPENKYYVNKSDFEKWKYLKGSKRIERTSKKGFKYIYSEGAISFPDPIDKPARTMLTSEGTKNRSSHVIEDPRTSKLRILTPLETERIQGFDDGWTDGMPERMKYFCMGNALPVPLVTRMGFVLNEIFDSE